MSLKYEVESLEGLDESVAGLYVEHEGKYRLGVEGIPEPKANDDVTGLKNKVQQLLDEKKREQEERRKEQELRKSKELEAAKASGDVQALEKSWTEKLNTEKQTYEQQLQSLNGMINNLTVGSTATKLAAELAVQGSADVLLPHIQNRLKVEVVDGNPVVRVLDREGKPSAATVDELKNEFLNNQSFAPIISGTKASGAGHRGAGSAGGASKKYTDYNGAELAEIRKKSPETYNQLYAEYKQSKQ